VARSSSGESLQPSYRIAITNCHCRVCCRFVPAKCRFRTC